RRGRGRHAGALVGGARLVPELELRAGAGQVGEEARILRVQLFRAPELEERLPRPPRFGQEDPEQVVILVDARIARQGPAQDRIEDTALLRGHEGEETLRGYDAGGVGSKR